MRFEGYKYPHDIYTVDVCLDEIEIEEKANEVPTTKDELKADRVKRRFKRNRFANRALKKGIITVADKFDEDEDLECMRKYFSLVSFLALICRNSTSSSRRVLNTTSWASGTRHLKSSIS